MAQFNSTIHGTTLFNNLQQYVTKHKIKKYNLRRHRIANNEDFQDRDKKLVLKHVQANDKRGRGIKM